MIGSSIEPQALSVTEAIEIVNSTLRDSLGQILVEGEVSGFQIRQGKWVTFSLKDQSSKVECFLFIGGLRVQLEDGMQVRVLANTKLASFGKFSLTPIAIELVGEGALRRAYDLLFSKLEQEGLFDTARKRLLPRFPERIGLVTSSEGAALGDVRRVLSQRWGGFSLMLYPVSVQGKDAISSIVKALEYFNSSTTVDLLILTRGGGSLEDLQAFNSEDVARAVAASRTPTIVAVGHESDTSIAELVADLRAATPSNAAQLAVPDRETVALDLARIDADLEGIIEKRLARARQAITRLITTSSHTRLKLDHALEQLGSSLKHWQLAQPARFAGLRQILGSRNQTVTRFVTRIIDGRAVHLKQLTARATQLGPQQVLARGYSFTKDLESGRILRTVANAKAGQQLDTHLADGVVRSEVIHVQATN